MTNKLQLKLLNTEEVSTLYDKCLDILSSKGVKVNHPQALKILDKAGAWVNFDNQQVRFPKDIIGVALRSVPHGLTLVSSDECNDLIVPHPSGAFYALPGSACDLYHDPDSNTYRDVTMAKLAEWVQLVEVLGEINICGSLTPTDVPVETADIHALKTVLENTSKPKVVTSLSPESLEYLFQLALVVAGSTEALKKRPIISIMSCSLSPLEFKTKDIEIIILSCRYGVPIHLASVPSAGGTSPITIAGTVLQCSIEILAMLVISQLIEPGLPVIGAPYIFTLDMLTGRALRGSVEGILCAAAIAQFIKDAFRIPVQSDGFTTDSYLPDGQSMLQKTLKAQLASMAGAAILHGAGRTGGISTASPVQLILDNTLAGILKGVSSGVKVDDDALVWKEILDTIPGGHFLERAHTLQHCREALRPELFVLPPMEVWSSEGSKDLYTRAVEEYRELKKKLQPQQLPEDVQKELNQIVKQADERLAK